MIPVFKPSMRTTEIKAVTEVLKSGWIGLGPKTKEFEEKFADYIGTKYALGVNSATAALHLAMKVLGVERGEVITTPMTFVSTNHAILYNNAVPVFCDIEADTLNIDANKIEALITKKTKAVVVVHYGGYAVDIDKVMKISKKYKLKVIEDVAHGCGGEYKSQKLGSIGDIGCFSFHAVKNLATGDGGMITTNDKKIYEKLLKLRWMGITKDTWRREERDFERYSWYYNVEEVGFKYHMNDITASIGLVQLSKLDTMNRKRFEIFQIYSKALASFKNIQLPVIKAYMTRPACHNYVIKLKERDRLNEYLKQHGISTGVHYFPNNEYVMYKRFKGRTPIAQEVWRRILTLPLFPDLEAREIKLIISSIKEFFR